MIETTKTKNPNAIPAAIAVVLWLGLVALLAWAIAPSGSTPAVAEGAKAAPASATQTAVKATEPSNGKASQEIWNLIADEKKRVEERKALRAQLAAERKAAAEAKKAEEEAAAKAAEEAAAAEAAAAEQAAAETYYEEAAQEAHYETPAQETYYEAPAAQTYVPGSVSGGSGAPDGPTADDLANLTQPTESLPGDWYDNYLAQHEHEWYWTDHYSPSGGTVVGDKIGAYVCGICGAVQ